MLGIYFLAYSIGSFLFCSFFVTTIFPVFRYNQIMNNILIKPISLLVFITFDKFQINTFRKKL